MKYFTEKEPWLQKYLLHRHLQIFYSGKSYVKKNNIVYLLEICVNFPCKIEKFE